jgi:hypothetical protein
VNEVPDNPFDGEANRLADEKNITILVARDIVIRKYLNNGDTRPLAFWLEKNHPLGSEVRLLLAFMLQPTRENSEFPGKFITVPPGVVPFELKATRRDGKRGRHNDLGAAERNNAILKYYHKRCEEIGPGSSESVIAEIAAFPDLNESIVREAIKSRSPKSA